jgi:hypothetical protein
VIPKTWDDQAMATLEVPLANPIGSPKHVSADYYYKIPVRPIYKQYHVYAPGHEPTGYMDWLEQQEPQIIWDDSTHRPTLRTEADWTRAGEIVFDSPIAYGGLFGGFPTETLYVTQPEFYRETGTPVAARRNGALLSIRDNTERTDQNRNPWLRHVPHPRDAGRINSERGPGQLSV